MITGFYLTLVFDTDKAEIEYDQGFYGPEFVFSMNFGVPDEIGKLSELKLFHLHQRYGTSGTLAVFSNLTELESLYLEYNNFLGEIPVSFANDHPNLVLLNVAHNGLNGSLPSSLTQIKNLTTLVLGGNQLSGQIPFDLGLAPNLGEF